MLESRLTMNRNTASVSNEDSHSTFTSIDEFINGYKIIHNREPTNEEIQLKILTELERAISDDDEDSVENLSCIIDNVWDKFTTASDATATEGNSKRRTYTLKPVHIAAREGYLLCLKFFLKRGFHIDGSDQCGQTLIHYAAAKNQLCVLKQLIALDANLNAEDDDGLTGLHVAALYGNKECVETLLSNGANFLAVDKSMRKSIDLATNQGIVNVLSSTEKLMKSVRKNDATQVVRDIKAGALINAKDAKGTPLHYASWKGYVEIVKILLDNGANPNILGGENSFTPLHYAAKFSHMNIVKYLLSYGAIYDALSRNGKTPEDFSDDKAIISLLRLVGELFTEIKRNDANVFCKKMVDNYDVDTFKALMNARNKENETYEEVLTKFSETIQDDSQLIAVGELLENNGYHERAMHLFEKALEITSELVGDENYYNSLETRTRIAEVLFSQGNYQASLEMHKEILLKRIDFLGPYHAASLISKCSVALTLHKLDRNEEALAIYEEAFPLLRSVHGPNHINTLEIDLHRGLVLYALGIFDVALKINSDVFNRAIAFYGFNSPVSLRAQSNRALVLVSLGKYEEALNDFNKVLEKRKMILGIAHRDTLLTLQNIADIMRRQNNLDEALKRYQEVLKLQMEFLPKDHPDIFDTQYDVANILFAQNKRVSALKAFRELLDCKATLIRKPEVAEILEKIEMLNSSSQDMGGGELDFVLVMQNELNVAARNGNILDVRRTLSYGPDVNGKDSHGKTPLLNAVENGHADIVKLLLKSGASLLDVDIDGNTSLHLATSRSHLEIVDLLLQETMRFEFHDSFINTQTINCSSTSLHIAAKSGSFEIVLSLLKCGAKYNVEDNEGKTPLELSTNISVSDLLNLIQDLFAMAKSGNEECISKLRALETEAFTAALNANDAEGRKLVQVAVANEHKDLAGELLRMLKVRT